MSDQSLFENNPESGQEQQPEQKPSPQQPAQTPTDLLGLINGAAGTNYDSFEKLGGGLKAKEEHISTLESENAKLREQLQEQEALKEKLAQMTQQQEQSPQEAPVLDETKLAQMLDATLQQREQQATAQQNEMAVTKALQEKFGDKAAEMLGKKAAEMGVDMAFMQQVAQRSPQAVMAYFGDTKPAANPGVTTSSVNTGGQQQQQQEPITHYKPEQVATQNDLVARFRETMKEFAGDENPFQSERKSSSW